MNVLSPPNTLYLGGGIEQQPVDTMTAATGSRIDVRAIWTALRRNLPLIVGTVAAALIAALIVTLLTTPRYIAQASVQIDQESDRVLSTQDVQPTSAYQDADRFLQTEVDVLQSRAMAIRVAQALKLFGNADFYRAMNAKDSLGTGRPDPVGEQEKTLGLLSTNLRVNLPRNSRVVAISFESPDAVLAARIANTYAKAFITGNLQRKYESSAYARDFLGNQLVEAKARLENTERQLNAYARSAGLINTQGAAPAAEGSRAAGGSQSVTTASLVQLNQAYNAAQSTRIAAEQKWRTVESAPLLSIGDVLSNRAVQDLLQQRAIKTVALREERARHRDDYPAVQEAQAQVTELNTQVNTLASSIRASIRDDYLQAQRQEAALAGQVSGLKGATLSEQDRSVQYNILAREVDTNRTLYDGLLQRFKEVSAASGIASNNISVVDQADPPIIPSSPKLFFNMALALLAGFALAAALVFFREQIDDTVRAPADIEAKLGIPLLGTIPKTNKDESVLEALAMPRSPVAEAYSALRTSLLFSTMEGMPSSLLITSSQPAEGKSTTSYAIASDIARLGKKVALIDGDLRRPSLHRVIGTTNDVGLSSLLTRQARLEDSLRKPDGHEFWFMSSGPIPPNPTDLLAGDRFGELLATLKPQFDVVVVDGPPVLGLADAPMLSAELAATLLIVESNRGYRGRTKGAVRRLRTGRGHLIGAVLTKFNAKAAGFGEEYGYDYYTYSSAETKR